MTFRLIRFTQISDRNLVAQQVSSFSFTVYIPCKLDSSLFYVES